MDTVRTELAELRRLIERQQQEISDLKSRIAERHESRPGDHPTRRALLAGAVAAVAGGAALVTSSPAEAGNGDPLILGVPANSATSNTGLSVSGSPVYGVGVTDVFLDAFPHTATIAGHTAGNFAAGVLGYDNFSSGRHGVIGRSVNGVGVFGRSARRGVHGYGGSTAPNSIGVLADGATHSTALAVNGVLRARRAGRATIPAGTRTKVVTLSPLTGTSLVLATVQKVAGTIAVQAVTVKATAPTSFTIRLNANAPAGGMPVAWVVIDTIGTALS